MSNFQMNICCEQCPWPTIFVSNGYIFNSLWYNNNNNNSQKFRDLKQNQSVKDKQPDGHQIGCFSSAFNYNTFSKCSASMLLYWNKCFGQ